MESSVFVPDPAALDRALEGRTAADVAVLVCQGLRGPNPGSLLALCDAAARRGLRDPALSVAEATLRFAVGDRERAESLVTGVLEAVPEHLPALALLAQFRLAAGDAASSRELLSRVVDRFPDYPGAQATLARLLFPGPHYREVLARIHVLLRPKTYLEIGVETGATLALARTAEVAVGVDPAEAPTTVPLPAAARVVRTTSDAFFARETVASAFQGRPVDLTFIDGMHWFEYALRDFVNAERWASPDGVILLHDCLPPTRVAALRERASTFWVGDVWKVLEVLLERRPDLAVSLVPAPPSGLVVVRKLDPTSTVLERAQGELIERDRERAYPHEPGRWPAAYDVVRNDDTGLRRALGLA
ncbi:MAG TPA: class I SAM-dependent methyltransferase [Polyangiaceae bacterium]|nr:class I SAM-dependent methyltransferase [Polyangiaceae bacterium]